MADYIELQNKVQQHICAWKCLMRKKGTNKMTCKYEFPKPVSQYTKCEAQLKETKK